MAYLGKGNVFEFQDAGTRTAVLTVPAGAVEGTRLLAFFTLDGAASVGDEMGSPLLSNSSPWALKKSISFGSDGQTLVVCENTIVGTPPGSYTLTYLDGSGYGLAQIHGWSDRSGATVYGADSSATGAETSPVDALAAGVTASAGDDLCVVAATDQNELGTWAVTQPSGMTSREAFSSTTEYTTLAVSTQDNLSAGATGDKSTTFTQLGVDAQGWATYAIAMPGSGGPPPSNVFNPLSGRGGAAAQPLAH